MKNQDSKKGSENLNEVVTLDATTTKSDKKGGKKIDATICDNQRKKSEITSDLRALFDVDYAKFESGIKELSLITWSGGGFKLLDVLKKFVQKDWIDKNGFLPFCYFEGVLREFKKACKPLDVSTLSEFRGRAGVSPLLSELLNLYGKSWDDVQKVFFIDGKIKVYSKEQNEDKTLIAEGGLFFKQLDEINAANIIAGIAGAGVFFERLRVDANKKANDKKQAFKAFENLQKRGLSAELLAMIAAELKNK